MSTNTNLNVNRKSPSNNEIDLLELAKALLSKWYLLIICVVIGAVVASFVTDTEVIPVYSSQSLLFVAKTGDITSFSDLQLSSYMLDDYIVIAKSKPVLDTAIQNLYEKDGVLLTREEASMAISITEVENTHILQFNAIHHDPKIACDLCNAITDAMADQIAYIMNTDRPSIVERAEENPYPINISNNSRSVYMGAAGGFAICAVIICVMFLMDDKIKTAEDIEKYIGAPVLISIPLDKAQTFRTSRKSSKNS